VEDGGLVGVAGTGADGADATFEVERIGGAAGFGGAHLKSRGAVTGDALAPEDRARIDTLFDGTTLAAHGADEPGERFRITRRDAHGERTITLPHAQTPPVLRESVRDTLE
jgi:hypothetical protein